MRTREPGSQSSSGVRSSIGHGRCGRTGDRIAVRTAIDSAERRTHPLEHDVGDTGLHVTDLFVR